MDKDFVTLRRPRYKIFTKLLHPLPITKKSFDILNMPLYKKPKPVEPEPVKIEEVTHDKDTRKARYVDK